MRTLAEFVIARREALGLKQNELAARADVPANMVNRIEKGVTKLPSPDYRRRLAKGLGVSHLDILVAAGELEPDEVEAAGVEGVVDDTNSPKARVQRAIDGMTWNDADAEQAIRVIGALRGAFTPRIDPARYDRKPGNT
jgi:transcriptional regulator with XRE-family HTH domain